MQHVLIILFGYLSISWAWHRKGKLKNLLKRFNSVNRPMRRIYRKDFKTRVLYHNNEILTKVLKVLTLNPYLPTVLKVNTKQSLDLISAYKTRFTNLCLITSRTRSVYRAFRLSRIKLRELCLAGKLPGVRKQS